MDIRLLKHFLTLAETLHYGRAADLCHLSPSALSRSIKQLEATLAVTLFNRDNRHVELTAEGRIFQKYARESLSQWDSLRNTLLSEAQELQGEVSVYCSVTASYSFLYDLLRQFRSQHPRIEIKLHTGDPAAAISQVLKGEEDIAIAARPNQLPAGLAFRSIGLSPLVFIAPQQDPWISPLLEPDLEAIDWSAIPMILSERGLARERVDEWFRQKAIKPNIYAQVSGNEAIVSMVSLGLGVGVVPKIVLDNSPLADRVQLLDITPRLAAYDVGVCALERKLRSPLIQAFWSQIQT
ncbi:LysR family transcriptional regulator, positive regulator for ilvC [Marinospirillum celere]|uniref:LysR family transcriptional regulator, positive regulator for ilvC n=1 Tax=Marinospirillum celere TaxID=1122252 RepID=A0A1I1JQY6_9GAMM|nr:HTH-type transcriptional activator IlvY [Marinospirillum celere]SFC50611.1 LysR family transcriptional regulator, positive regulator for ilvC [Marinospirillum celere]